MEQKGIIETIDHFKEQAEIFGGDHKAFMESAIGYLEKYRKINGIKREPQSRRIQVDEEHIKAHAHEYTLLDYMKTFRPNCSITTLRKRAIELGVSFKRDPRRRDNGTSIRVALDEEHIKAHAHEYTCLEYYNKFNPPCARTTLINRARELGIQFKKRAGELPFDEDVMTEAKERSETIGIKAFYEEMTAAGRIDPKKTTLDRFRVFCSERHIHFARPPYRGEYTKEEDAIVREYYPVLGSKCADLLPGKTVVSVRAYASRNNIAFTGERDWLKGVPRKGNRKPCTDHLGNRFESVEALLKHYGISGYILRDRLRRGWNLEKALCTPVARKKTPGVKTYDHEGNEYPSQTEMCRHYKVSASLYRHRIEAGWSVKDALLKRPYEK